LMPDELPLDAGDDGGDDALPPLGEDEA
jgi:hypothetical protein